MSSTTQDPTQVTQVVSAQERERLRDTFVEKNLPFENSVELDMF